jgi:hypothetical protein
MPPDIAASHLAAVNAGRAAGLDHAAASAAATARLIAPTDVPDFPGEPDDEGDPTDILTPPPHDDDPDVLDWEPGNWGDSELHVDTSGTQAVPNVRLVPVDPLWPLDDDKPVGLTGGAA